MSVETGHQCVLKVPEHPEPSTSSVTSALTRSFSGVFDTSPHTAGSRFSRVALYPQSNSAGATGVGAQPRCACSQVYPTDSLHPPPEPAPSVHSQTITCIIFSSRFFNVQRTKKKHAFDRCFHQHQLKLHVWYPCLWV